MATKSIFHRVALSALIFSFGSSALAEEYTQNSLWSHRHASNWQFDRYSRIPFTAKSRRHHACLFRRAL